MADEKSFEERLRDLELWRAEVATDIRWQTILVRSVVVVMVVTGAVGFIFK